MKASTPAPTGRTLPLGWTPPDGELPASHGLAAGETPATGPGASWRITSDTGYAVFTSAPGADGSAGTSQIVPFIIDAIVLLDPSGELQIELSQNVVLNIVTCVDVEDGSHTTVLRPIEGESVAICRAIE